MGVEDVVGLAVAGVVAVKVLDTVGKQRRSRRARNVVSTKTRKFNGKVYKFNSGATSQSKANLIAASLRRRGTKARVTAIPKKQMGFGRNNYIVWSRG